MLLITLSDAVRKVLQGVRGARDYAQADGCAYCRVVKGREAVRGYLSAVGAEKLGFVLTNEAVSAVAKIGDVDRFPGDGWAVDLEAGCIVAA